MSNYFNTRLPSYEESESSLGHSTKGLYHDASEDSYKRGQVHENRYGDSDEPIAEDLKQYIQKKGYKNCVAMNSQQWNPDNDTLTFRQADKKQVDKDLTVQASHPVCGELYFEVTVQNLLEDCTLAIGLTTKKYPLFRLPGWNRTSIGYHSDDGHRFINDSCGGQKYGPAWEQHSTVGCYFNSETGRVYFTHDGFKLEDANIGSGYTMYPSVGCDSNAEITINFGKEGFKYVPPKK